jgi:hypothetical protein
MRFLCICCLTLLPDFYQMKAERFVGRLQSMDVADGVEYYHFIGLNGKDKSFSQGIESQQFYSVLNDGDHRGKWFEINYYDYFGPLGDDEEPYWYSSIVSIKMITIPNRKNTGMKGTFVLYDFFMVEEILANFVFINRANGDEATFTCDVTTLATFPFDFHDPLEFSKKYKGHDFKVAYKIEYQLGSKEPITNRMLALRLCD